MEGHNWTIYLMCMPKVAPLKDGDPWFRWSQNADLFGHWMWLLGDNTFQMLKRDNSTSLMENLRSNISNWFLNLQKGASVFPVACITEQSFVQNINWSRGPMDKHLIIDLEVDGSNIWQKEPIFGKHCKKLQKKIIYQCHLQHVIE